MFKVFFFKNNRPPNPAPIELDGRLVAELSYQISSMTAELGNLRDVMQGLSNTIYENTTGLENVITSNQDILDEMEITKISFTRTTKVPDQAKNSLYSAHATLLTQFNMIMYICEKEPKLCSSWFKHICNMNMIFILVLCIKLCTIMNKEVTIQKKIL